MCLASRICPASTELTAASAKATTRELSEADAKGSQWSEDSAGSGAQRCQPMEDANREDSTAVVVQHTQAMADIAVARCVRAKEKQ